MNLSRSNNFKDHCNEWKVLRQEQELKETKNHKKFPRTNTIFN